MTSNQLFDLEKNDCIITVSGEDATSFLQGQVTCDINTLTSTNSLFGSFCNPKGRVISLFYIAKRSDIFYLIVPVSLRETLIKRLRMFVFRSKVQIEDKSDGICVLGSLSKNSGMHINHLATISLAKHTPLSFLIVKSEELNAFNTTADEKINADCTQWNQSLIKAVIPRVTDLTSELFIPQTLNLDVLDGISLTKGCYTGQEIIARLHYKGTVKRRLYLFESSIMIEPATDVFSSEDNSSIGTILNCMENTNTTYCGTLVIKNSAALESKIICNEVGSITIEPPPYPLNLK